MRTIRLETALPNEWAAAQTGKYLDAAHYDPDKLISGEPVDVYKPDGSPLLLFRPGALPLEVCAKAHAALLTMSHRRNDHRDYIVSNAVGYYNCRKTAFTRDKSAQWRQCIGFIRRCNDVFLSTLPRRYVAQRRVALCETPQDWVIGRTAFTTVTVNLWDDTHDARTRVHKDAGDLPEGFGVISVLSEGDYTGGYLIFPQYAVAVDMRTTDVLLCDVHEWHGNGPVVGEPGWQRLSCIFYYRTDMRNCPDHWQLAVKFS